MNIKKLNEDITKIINEVDYKMLAANDVESNDPREEVQDKFFAYKEHVIQKLKNFNLNSDKNDALNISNSLNSLYNIIISFKNNDFHAANMHIDMAQNSLDENLKG